MAFQPRSLDQILSDMSSYILTNPGVPPNALVPGSVILSILEAAALEDDEQYFQMIRLLDAFSITSATGSDLDKRAAEYDIYRSQPSFATVTVYIRNESLAKTYLAEASLVGATTIKVNSSTGFTSAPFSILVDTGTINQESATVTSVTTVGNYKLFTLSAALTKTHSVGVLVTDATSTAKNIPQGIKISTKPDPNNPSIIYITKEEGYIGPGQYESTPIIASAILDGSTSRVTKEALVSFATSAPFTGASVINKTASSGGANLESDDSLRGKIRGRLQGLSRSTRPSIKNALLGVVDGQTGQQVKSVGIVEDFEKDEVNVYIDDGTGFTPEVLTMGSSTLSALASIGNTSFTISSVQNFPTSGYALLSVDEPTQVELVKYKQIDVNTNVVTLVTGASLAKNHDNTDKVDCVELVVASAEDGQNYFKTRNFPIEENSFELWVGNANNTGFVKKVLGTDYYLYRGTGDIEMTGLGLSTGQKVVVKYNHYSGLVRTCQRIIDGDDRDPELYPGVKAEGIHVSVKVPDRKEIEVVVTLTLDDFGDFDTLKPSVESLIQNYILMLGVGGNFIIMEIASQIMQLPGILDVQVEQPTSNITVAENELPHPFDSNGNSLITVY